MSASPKPDGASVYFPGLNGIRAIAACSVMVVHVLVGLPRLGGTSAFRGGISLAGNAVVMFFTLSGFLITYLLLEEQKTCGAISFRRFYLRRILRIWPLYFFYIALALTCHALLGTDTLNTKYIVLFVLFLPNIAFNLGRYMPDTGPLWSIGIEEQFYAMWPIVVSRVKHLRAFLVALIVGVLGLRVAMHLVGNHLASSIVDSLGYDSMAIGALTAVLYRASWSPLMRVARSPLPHLAFAAVVVLHAVNGLTFLNLLAGPLTAGVTAAFIVAQIAGSRRLLNLELPILDYLGKISFGIYVYHSLVMTLLVRAFRAADVVPPGALVVALVAAATFVVAGLSYRVLEKPFLDFKDSLARVKTPGAS